MMNLDYHGYLNDSTLDKCFYKKETINNNNNNNNNNNTNNNTNNNKNN